MTGALGIVDLPPDTDGEPIDWAEVHALLSGRRIRTSSAARRWVVAALTARRETAAAIAARTGMSERAVQRYRAQTAGAAA